jgi:LuxR family maltose regulon positive regulatory protein
VTIESLAVGGPGEGRDRRLSHLELVAPDGVKLHPPRIRADAIERGELVGALRAAEGVVVLTAPAGYGKSTLLAQAVRDDPQAAWLTLTPEDNDLVVLVAYLARALDTVHPLKPEDVAALTAPGGDALTVTLPRLGRLLAHQPLPFRLVLDDLHVLRDPHCLRVIEVLVSHLPAGSTLVLSGRRPPPLALGRLRTQLDILEIDAPQLAMTREESVALLRSAGVDGAVTEVIAEAAEGWPAGLYIEARVARLGHGRGQPHAGPGRRAVEDYLAEEVISGLPDASVQFLLSTCVLGVVDGMTCDAVLEHTGSAAMLDELCRDHLFVIPEGPEGSYRYHPLFADALRSLLRTRDPRRERALHTRASIVFEERADIGAAIRHAHQAGDIERAASLVWRHTALMAGSGRGATVGQWLACFTDEEIAALPPLAAARCWCGVTSRDAHATVYPWLDLLRRHDPAALLPDGVPVGAIVALLDALVCERGLAGLRASAERAIALDGTDRPYRFVATYVLGCALALEGDGTGARSWLEASVEPPGVPPAIVVNAMAQLVLLAADEEEWDSARRLLDRASALSDHFGLREQPLQVCLLATEALVAAHERRSADARHAANHARRLLADIDELAPWMQVQARVVLVRAQLELGDPRAAKQVLTEARGLLARLEDAQALRRTIDELGARVREANRSATSLVVPLTTAELRVLSYLPTHLTYQAIAEDLLVSRNTVKTQTISIYRKLGVTSRPDAVERSRELDLLVDTV